MLNDNRIVVDVADMRVTNDINAVIVTYALGSCIAVTINDPVAKVGGMLHYMLPESSIDKQKAEMRPFMFGDTGIPLLFKEAYKYGAIRDRIIVKLAGGASIQDASGAFNIGKRNYLMARKMFWKNNVMIDGESVGGMISRTLYLEMATGRVYFKSSGMRDVKI
jgi:chemotaxis protein CheD